MSSKWKVFQVEIINYIKTIKILINSESDYETYRYVFKEYIDFLEKRLRHNPSDIKAVCQLARR